MASPGPSGEPLASPPRLRRDAQRNRDAILTAAAQVFCDQGLEAPLEEIARRAQVGIGTLYRRFPSRVELLDAVLTDTLQAHIDLAERALAMDDPWEGFCFYLEETCRLQAPTAASTTPWACGSPGPPPWRRPGGTWRRHLGFLLDGFRADRAAPLPERPWHPGRSTGPCSPSAAAPPGGGDQADPGGSRARSASGRGGPPR